MLQGSPPDTPSDEELLDRLNANATQMGLNTVEIGGFLVDLSQQCQSQSQAIAALKSGSDSVTQASTLMQTGLEDVLTKSDETLSVVEASLETLSANARRSTALADWVRSVHENGSEMEGMLAAVRRSNDQIGSIASQVNILAMNAKIEAARAGEAGRGFAIVAEAINDLAQKTGLAADSVSDTVAELVAWMNQLQTGAEHSVQNAHDLLEASSETDGALARIEQQARASRTSAETLQDRLSLAAAEIAGFAPAVTQIDAAVGTIFAGVDEATARTNTLIDRSECIVQGLVELGAVSEDQGAILMVQDLAGQIGQRMQAAVDSGEMTLADLFDTDYRPVPGVEPAQVTTRFVEFTDRVLPAFLEPPLETDERVIFCAAVDRNGYLPTHNRKFSHPPGPDPIWNTAHCRNRRIFDDRVGLKAGQNTGRFLLQVYRRDMGGGDFAIMKDLSAPIFVNGQHWGGLRLGYKF